VHYCLQIDELVQQLKAKGEMTPCLLECIKELALTHGWHTANTRRGYTADAAKDKAKLCVLLEQLCCM
jgi:hypothetical protein